MTSAFAAPRNQLGQMEIRAYIEEFRITSDEDHRRVYYEPLFKN
jgi:hypothetical protein